MIIPILPSLMRLSHHQCRQDKLIHLADAKSHGVAALQIRSFSSQLPSISHGSSAKANHPRVIPSTSNPTKIYENSLASATSVDVQATKCQPLRQHTTSMLIEEQYTSNTSYILLHPHWIGKAVWVRVNATRYRPLC